MTKGQSKLTKGCINVCTNRANVYNEKMFLNSVTFTRLAHATAWLCDAIAVCLHTQVS